MVKQTVSRARAEKVLTALSEGEPVESGEQWTVLRALPPGLELELVYRAFEKSLTRPHEAATLGASLNPHYLEFYRELVARHPAWPQAIAAAHLTASTPEGRTEQLAQALTRLEALGTPNLTHAQLEGRVREFAADPHFVDCVRAVVAGADFPPGREFHRFALMNLLLEDGSQESVDVLLPFIQKALEDGGARLEGWRALLRSKPRLGLAVRPLRELLESDAASRRGGLHRDRVARALQLKTVPQQLAWKWRATSLGEQEWTASVQVDLDADPWFKVTVTDGARTSSLDSNGTRRDELRLGPLKDLLDFPAWFAAATATLGVAWGGPGEGVSDELSWSTLRGKPRRALSLWHWSGMPPH